MTFFPFEPSLVVSWEAKFEPAMIWSWILRITLRVQGEGVHLDLVPELVLVDAALGPAGAKLLYLCDGAVHVDDAHDLDVQGRHGQ